MGKSFNAKLDGIKKEKIRENPSKATLKKIEKQQIFDTEFSNAKDKNIQLHKDVEKYEKDRLLLLQNLRKFLDELKVPGDCKQSLINQAISRLPNVETKVKDLNDLENQWKTNSHVPSTPEIEAISQIETETTALICTELLQTDFGRNEEHYNVPNFFGTENCQNNFVSSVKMPTQVDELSWLGNDDVLQVLNGLDNDHLQTENLDFKQDQAYSCYDLNEFSSNSWSENVNSPNVYSISSQDSNISEPLDKNENEENEIINEVLKMDFQLLDEREEELVLNSAYHVFDTNPNTGLFNYHSSDHWNNPLGSSNAAAPFNQSYELNQNMNNFQFVEVNEPFYQEQPVYWNSLHQEVIWSSG